MTECINALFWSHDLTRDQKLTKKGNWRTDSHLNGRINQSFLE